MTDRELLEDAAKAAGLGNESWRGQFGGCGCGRGLTVCDCGLSDSGHGRVAQDLPVNRWTIATAIVIVALAAFVSSFFPMGFAP